MNTIRSRSLPVLAGGLSLLSAGCHSGAQPALNSGLVDRPDAPRPNILMIVSDDHGYADMTRLGLENGVRTPNLDRLAESGTVFTDAYATSPICSPSRCGLLTGSYQQRWGNRWYGGPGISEQSPTISGNFQELGYRTGYIGKYHYGHDSDRSRPENHGFDYSLTASHGGRTHFLYHSTQAVEKFGEEASSMLRMNMRPMKENGKEVDRDGFTTELFARQSETFMSESLEAGKPFFLQLAFNAVHNFTWQLPDEYLEELGLPKTDDWHPSKGSYTEWYDEHIRPNLKNGRAYYLAQLYYMDREIGKLMDFLEEKGIADNTLIVYTSDNGGSMCNWGINTPLRGSKYTLYEGGIRVPMMMSWKGKIAAGATNSEMISGMDLMPTLLDAAGRTGATCDGISFYPNLTEGRPIERDTLVWDTRWQWAVRQGKWKLKVVVEPGTSRAMSYEHTDPGLGTQLYNLEEDISETTDLSDQYPQKVKELKAIHKKWKRGLKGQPGNASALREATAVE